MRAAAAPTRCSGGGPTLCLLARLPRSRARRLDDGAKPRGRIGVELERAARRRPRATRLRPRRARASHSARWMLPRSPRHARRRSDADAATVREPFVVPPPLPRIACNSARARFATGLLRAFAARSSSVSRIAPIERRVTQRPLERRNSGVLVLGLQRHIEKFRPVGRSRDRVQRGLRDRRMPRNAAQRLRARAPGPGPRRGRVVRRALRDRREMLRIVEAARAPGPRPRRSRPAQWRPRRAGPQDRGAAPGRAPPGRG